MSSYVNDSMSSSGQTPSIATTNSESSTHQHSIDALFDGAATTNTISSWEPVRPPQVLGELLDSRYMLPLLFPSDPRMLAAVPGQSSIPESGQNEYHNTRLSSESRSGTGSNMGSRNTMPWRLRSRKVREVGVGTLQWVDGIRSAARWNRMAEPDEGEDEEEPQPQAYASDDSGVGELKVNTHITHLTRKPSGRSKGRPSAGGEITPIEHLKGIP